MGDSFQTWKCETCGHEQRCRTTAAGDFIRRRCNKCLRIRDFTRLKGLFDSPPAEVKGVFQGLPWQNP